jgi:hypothetical protein
MLSLKKSTELPTTQRSPSDIASTMLKKWEEKWSPGTDKTSAAIPKDWLKKILRAHTVEITAEDDRGSQLEMQFDMPNSPPVEDACSVDNPKK